jgi:hypothetical protein
LSCEACHRPASTVDGRVATRYKPLGTTCADCHGFGFEDEGGKGRGRGRGSDRDGNRDDGRRDDGGEREDDDQQQRGAARLRLHLLGELLERRSSEAGDQPR